MNKRMIISAIGMLCLAWISCTEEHKKNGTTIDKPHVTAASQIEAGRYLIITGGCNDCHTPGFMQDNNIPESKWLTGSPLGWQGPWGTTYAVNLRRSVDQYSEQEWIGMVRTRNARPPMVWFSLNKMSGQDLKAIYAYIKSLPLRGEAMPEALPPGQQPQTPFVNLIPQNMPPDTMNGIDNTKR